MGASKERGCATWQRRHSVAAVTLRDRFDLPLAPCPGVRGALLFRRLHPRCSCKQRLTNGANLEPILIGGEVGRPARRVAIVAHGIAVPPFGSQAQQLCETLLLVVID